MEWIPLLSYDDFPEENVEVLCIDRTHRGKSFIRVARYFEEDQVIEEEGTEGPVWIDQDGYILDKVTHWMPKPKIPEEENGLD